MPNCAFCGTRFKPGIKSFKFPLEISPEAKKVWEYEARYYIDRRNPKILKNSDKVCASHFADEAKEGAELAKLKRNAVPTIGVKHSGPSILPEPKDETFSVLTPLRERNFAKPVKVIIERVRSRPNRFHCNYCDQIYKSEATLNYHILDRHPEEVTLSQNPVQILSNFEIPQQSVGKDNANEVSWMLN